MQKWTAKMKSTWKTGQGAPGLQKVNSEKKVNGQRSTAKVKVNGQLLWWRQQDDVSRRPQLGLTCKADASDDVSKCTAARESILAGALVDAWRRVWSPMRPILLRWCRSEKDDFDDGSDELIGAILMAREACGKAVESLTGAWQLVDG